MSRALEIQRTPAPRIEFIHPNDAKSFKELISVTGRIYCGCQQPEGASR